MKNQKNFDLLINISKQHFHPNREMYLLDNPRSSRYKYINQLCKVLGENWPLIILKGDNKKFNKAITYSSGKNILFLKMETKDDILYTYAQSNKYLFYIDLREDDSTCSWKQYLNNIDKDDIWLELFQSIFLFHYQNNCSNEFEIWLREPWSANSGRKIENIKDAYFNKKPNLHGSIVPFRTTWYERENLKSEEMSLKLFKNIWYQKWNMVDTSFSWRFATILVEPGYMDHEINAYRMMSMCFVVQKGKEYPKWEVIVWCFHWKVWMWLAVIWFISGLAWFFIKKHSSLSQSFSEVYSLLITEPISWLPNLNTDLSRLIAGLFMLMSIVIITGFQSNLYKNIQVPMLYPPINEIKQIQELNLTIVCAYPYSCEMIFGRSLKDLYPDKLLRKMSHQVTKDSFAYLSKSNYYTLFDVYNNPNMSLVTSCESARLMINSIPVLSKKLHVVGEVIVTYPLSYEYFPFQSQLHQLLLSYFESGIGLWEKQMIESTELTKILRKEKKEPSIRVFNMDDLQVAFIILFIGLSISTFVFLLELISKHFFFSRDD